MSEELEVKKPGAIEVYSYEEDEGKGFENQTKADVVIPFIVVLQPTSPQVQVEGTHLRPGMFYNTVTEESWSREQGLLWVPATTRHVFAEWKPRKLGGGFVGHHEIDSEIVAKAVKAAERFGRNKTEDGNDLVETFYVYGAICSEDGDAESMACMTYKSTHIRPYKTWMTRLRQMTIPNQNGGRTRPPLYAHLTRFTTTMKQNDEGTWFIPIIKSADPRGLVHSLLPPTDARFQMAKSCRQMLESGDATIDPNQQNVAGDSADIPF